MPYVTSSQAVADLLGGGPPRVLDVTWRRDPELDGGAPRPVIAVLSAGFLGEVDYESSSHRGRERQKPESSALEVGAHEPLEAEVTKVTKVTRAAQVAEAAEVAEAAHDAEADVDAVDAEDG